MWPQLFGGLIKLVLPSLATVVGGMLVKVLQTQLQKQGIELTIAQQQKIAQIVEQAILAAEEMSRRQLKRAGTPMEGETKRELAVQMAQRQLPDVPAEAINAMIDARLPIVRATVKAAAQP